MTLDILIGAALALSLLAGISDIRTGKVPAWVDYGLLLLGAIGLGLHGWWVELAFYALCIFTTRGGSSLILMILAGMAIVFVPSFQAHLDLLLGMLFLWFLYLGRFHAGADFMVAMGLLGAVADVAVLFWIFGLTVAIALCAWIWKYRSIRRILERIQHIFSRRLNPDWEDPDTILAPWTAIACAGAAMFLARRFLGV